MTLCAWSRCPNICRGPLGHSKIPDKGWLEGGSRSVRAHRTKELRGKQGLQDVGLLWCLSLDLRFRDPHRVAAALFIKSEASLIRKYHSWLCASKMTPMHNIMFQKYKSRKEWFQLYLVLPFHEKYLFLLNFSRPFRREIFESSFLVVYNVTLHAILYT